jgi:P27 family predicted phage terminase small subunit
MNQRAPKHLRRATKQFWEGVLRDFALEEHHIRLLTAACEAWDRAVQAREAVERDGMFLKNRHGELKSHPGLLIERDARSLFSRLLRELNLDVDAPTEAYSRPPALVK